MESRTPNTKLYYRDSIMIMIYVHLRMYFPFKILTMITYKWCIAFTVEFWVQIIYKCFRGADYL